MNSAFALGAKNFKDSGAVALVAPRKATLVSTRPCQDDKRLVVRLTGITHSVKVPVPERAPDKIEEFKTSPYQTHVRRLCRRCARYGPPLSPTFYYVCLSLAVDLPSQWRLQPPPHRPGTGTGPFGGQCNFFCSLLRESKRFSNVLFLSCF